MNVTLLKINLYLLKALPLIRLNNFLYIENELRSINRLTVHRSKLACGGLMKKTEKIRRPNLSV